MKKIYLDTLKGYFTSYAGYLFLALSLLVAGATFFWYNIMLRSVDLAAMFKLTMWAVIFLCPFLTFKTTNRKNIIPKHLAGLTLIFSLVIIMLTFAVVVMILGTPNILHILGLYLAFFLLSATFLALATFVTVLVGNTVMSFIITTMLFAAIRIVDFFASGYPGVAWLSVCLRFEPFLNGIFSVTSIIYYLTTAILIIFATLMLKRRSFKAFLSFAIAICIFSSINLLTTIYPVEVYTNTTSNISLSEITLEVLSEIDKPVNIITFRATEDTSTGCLDELIAKYVESSTYIKTYSIDPATDLDTAELFSLPDKKVKNNSVVVESSGKFRLFNENELFVIDYLTQLRIGLSAEDKITTAIAQIDAPIKNIVCSEGHTETEIEFGNNSLKLQTVNLRNNDIPENTDIFFIVAPLTDFSKTEISKLDKYLEKGGKVQVYFDKDLPELIQLEEYLATWGIKFEKDYVLDPDPNHNFAGKITLLIPEIVSHPITNELISNREVILASSSRSITLEDTEYIVHFELLKTSAKSYSKTDPDAVKIEQESNDLPGPLVVAAGAEKDGSSILAFGTSQLIDPQNENLIINAINWQIDPESNIYIPSYEIENTVLTITEKQVTGITIMLALLPMLVFLAGLTVKMLKKPE